MVSQNLYDFSVSGAVRDVLVDNISSESSGHVIFTFMLCSKLAEALGESA